MSAPFTAINVEGTQPGSVWGPVGRPGLAPRGGRGPVSASLGLAPTGPPPSGPDPAAWVARWVLVEPHAAQSRVVALSPTRFRSPCPHRDPQGSARLLGRLSITSPAAPSAQSLFPEGTLWTAIRPLRPGQHLSPGPPACCPQSAGLSSSSTQPPGPVPTRTSCGDPCPAPSSVTFPAAAAPTVSTPRLRLPFISVPHCRIRAPRPACERPGPPAVVQVPAPAVTSRSDGAHVHIRWLRRRRTGQRLQPNGVPPVSRARPPVFPLPGPHSLPWGPSQL